MKVLLIDDDVDFARIHKAHLERGGFAVVVAYDSEGGIALAEAERPDLVILDYMLDEVASGSYVAKTLRASEALATVPIMLLTSVRVKHPWWRVEVDPERLPVDVIVDKPIAPERLVAEARRLCGLATERE